MFKERVRRHRERRVADLTAKIARLSEYIDGLDDDLVGDEAQRARTERAMAARRRSQLIAQLEAENHRVRN